jgi:hypothetical protein
MTFKEFIKTTEAIVVLFGLFLTVVSGRFWAITTAIVYVLINVPSAISWIKSKLNLNS